mgnify:CR=1
MEGFELNTLIDFLQLYFSEQGLIYSKVSLLFVSLLPFIMVAISALLERKGN